MHKGRSITMKIANTAFSVAGILDVAMLVYAAWTGEGILEMLHISLWLLLVGAFLITYDATTREDDSNG